MSNADVQELLKYVDAKILTLAGQATAQQINKIDLKNTLENMKSVLDYMAQDISLLPEYVKK